MESTNNIKAALEVLRGLWGNGQERRDRLTAAGYDAGAIQDLVNKMVGGTWPTDAAEERIMTVELDLSEYDGLNLILKNGGPENNGS